MNKYLRIGLIFLLPPLAVYDKGWDRILLTLLATIFIPFGGQLAAMFFLWADDQYSELKHNLGFEDRTTQHTTASQKPKREQPSKEYIRLADGDVLEIVDTDMEERRHRLQHE
jgi:hypothetical protein